LKEARESERMEILKLLEEQFGIDVGEMEKYRFLVSSNERIFILSCSGYPEIKDKYFMGCYFGKKERDGLRLSIEGSQIVGTHAKKGIVDITYDECVRWMSGEDITREGVTGYVILKWKDLILGCGKGNGRYIKNWIPADRRLNR